MFLLIEINIRGGISSVISIKNFKAVDKKKILYIAYFLEVDLTYPDNTKKNTKHFLFAPANKKNNPESFTTYMNKNKPFIHTQTEKKICDLSDKKNYLAHHRLLKLHVGHGIVVNKVQEIISFKQSSWLDNYINFNTQK